MEKYLKLNMDKYKKSLLYNLRFGTLNLKIESGRFSKTPRESQICKLCNTDVENELHFLFVCEKLQQEPVNKEASRLYAELFALCLLAY